MAPPILPVVPAKILGIILDLFFSSYFTQPQSCCSHLGKRSTMGPPLSTLVVSTNVSHVDYCICSLTGISASTLVLPNSVYPTVAGNVKKTTTRFSGSQNSPTKPESGPMSASFPQGHDLSDLMPHLAPLCSFHPYRLASCFSSLPGVLSPPPR